MRQIFYFCARVLSVFVFLMLTEMSGQLSALEMTTVRVLKNAWVEEDEIRLGEISEIFGKDRTLVQRLQGIVLAKAPHPGRPRYIGEDYIRMRLRQKGIDLSQISLIAPDSVKVFRRTVKISVQRIEQAVSGFIRQKLRWAEDRVRIKEIKVMDRVVLLPKGNVSIQVIAPRNTDYLGTICLSLLFTVNGSYQKKARATVKVEVMTDVVIADRPLRRHQLITEDDVRLQKMDLAELPSSAIVDLSEVMGKRIKRNINIDEIICGDIVELPPLVNRGDVVRIIAESDGLRVTALGEIREKGCRGERVSIVNLDSKKGIYGRVLDSRTVRVDF